MARARCQVRHDSTAAGRRLWPGYRKCEGVVDMVEVAAASMGSVVVVACQPAVVAEQRPRERC
jgi:hypothetical protein